MNSAAPIGGKRRGIRRWLATKIHPRTGLETRVGGASGSSWNGASISGVGPLQPAPLRALINQLLARSGQVRISPVWRASLRLKNASFAIVRTGASEALLEFSKTSGAIPLSGAPTRSAIKIGVISAFGNEVISDPSATLDWASPRLSLKPGETKIGGYQSVLAATIGSLQFHGLLLAPGSWQGDLVPEATSPSLRVSEHETKFDQGKAVMILRAGLLSCVDARLISDK